MKKDILDKVSIFLLRKGFTVKSMTRSCFDVFARDKEKILLIKFLEDANSISRDFAEEMRNIAACISATPLIIAEKATGKLEDNVVYSRFDITTLNPDTFMSCINNKFPLVKRTQAGLTVSLAGSKLKEKREQMGYSLNYMSRSIGVTSRMVVKYENEDSEITLNKAMKIYDLFGKEVFNEANVFSMKEKMPMLSESEYSRKYSDLGFNVADAHRAPFDIIARKEDELILTEVGDKTNPQMQSLSELLDADNLVIFRKHKPKDVPSVTRREFLEFEESNQLIKFLKEF